MLLFFLTKHERKRCNRLIHKKKRLGGLFDICERKTKEGENHKFFHNPNKFQIFVGYVNKQLKIHYHKREK